MLCVLSATALAAAPLDIDEPLRTGATAPMDSAVVIGLENYAYVALVPFARRDAQSFHDFLVYAKGVPLEKVRLIQTASAKMIERSVKEAAAEVGEGGTLWVYYAGHGAASASDGGRLLLADDVRQDPVAFEDSAVRVDDLQRIAQDAGVRAVLVLDTCYSGLGRSGDALVTGKRFAVPSYSMVPPPEITVWTAASGDELSGAFDAARHGSFTYFAVGALRGWADGELTGQRDGTVTRAEAQAYVSRALRSMGDRSQTPSLQGVMDDALAISVAEEGPDLAGLRAAAPEQTVSPPAPEPASPTPPTPAPAVSRYTVELSDVAFPSRRPDGLNWDLVGGPDISVWAKLDGQVVWRSPLVEDRFQGVFHAVVATGVDPAATPSVVFTVFDQDVSASDDAGRAVLDLTTLGEIPPDGKVVRLTTGSGVVVTIGVAVDGPTLRPSVAAPVVEPAPAAPVAAPAPESTPPTEGAPQSARWAGLLPGGKAIQAYGPLDIAGVPSYIYDSGSGCISQLASHPVGWRETMLIGAACTAWSSITVDRQPNWLTISGDGDAVRLDRQESTEGGLTGAWSGSFYVEQLNAAKGLGGLLGTKGPTISQSEVPIELSITSTGGATTWPITQCHGALDLTASGRDFSQFKERIEAAGDVCIAGATITVYRLTGESVLVNWIPPGAGPAAFGILHRGTGANP